MLGALALLAAPLLAPLPSNISRSALADPPASPPRSISEIRELQQAVEARHAQRSKEITDGLTIQSYDSDTALMLRMKADQEYKTNMETLRLEEQTAYNAMMSKPSRPGDAPARAPTSAAMPHFESQSEVSYPPRDGSAPAEEKPQREGKLKNVGFGTRELEY